MNLNELEAQLRELEPRRPSPGFIRRVLAQRPTEFLLKPVPWWQRRVAIPMPALAAALALFCLALAVEWRLARPHPSPSAKAPASASAPSPQTNDHSPTVTVAAASDVRTPDIIVTMSGKCSFQLDH